MSNMYCIIYNVNALIYVCVLVEIRQYILQFIFIGNVDKKNHFEL